MAGFRFKNKEQKLRSYLDHYVRHCDWHITEFKHNDDMVKEWTIKKHTALEILAQLDK